MVRVMSLSTPSWTIIDTRDCTKRLFIGLDRDGGHEVGPSEVHSLNNAVNCTARKPIVSLIQS